MKIKKSNTRFGRGQITNIWEVVLTQNDFRRIVKTAQIYQVSMSWIVRYCTFKTIQQNCYNMKEEMSDVISDIKENLGDIANRKRFFLCLYGDDEIQLRIMARSANLTVAMLIRLALYMFLPDLEKGTKTYADLFWFGIKFTQKIKYVIPIMATGHVQEFLIRTLFGIEDFWGIPPEVPDRSLLAA